ncbi:MAG: VacJ family lipoprotein [Burkholderiales bacterium]|jgi:phospholipid-binding lipoprotein MlaA|nr:VacJ family lipoprotein [Burkholderiales bacterium]
MKPLKAIYQRCAVVLCLLLSACATPMAERSDPRDPYENLNRKVFVVNQVFDQVLLKPVARGYSNYAPNFIQNTVGNFFGNLADVWTAVNNFLQGKPREGIQDTGRVAVNTVFGVAGLADVATKLGFPKHQEDFGQTLGVWGVKPGPYVMLPLFGPSTMRDAVAKPLDLYADPLNLSTRADVEYSLRAMRLVDDRARLLPTTDMIEKVALDPYQFVRDAHFQQREARVNDASANR